MSRWVVGEKGKVVKGKKVADLPLQARNGFGWFSVFKGIFGHRR